MDLSVREVARLLEVSEGTIYRWIRSGTLPAHRLEDQYRLNRVELQEWVAVRKMRVSPELFATDVNGSNAADLRAALLCGGVYYQVPGETREEVLAAAAGLPGIPATVDRELVASLLLRREALSSTGLGDGIAIPHPRNPLILGLSDPRVLLCFLANPVDFKAIDGRAVHVLFVLLSPTVRTHLQLLAKIAFAVHDSAFQELLRLHAPQEAILERVGRLTAPVPPAGHDTPTGLEVP